MLGSIKFDTVGIMTPPRTEDAGSSRRRRQETTPVEKNVRAEDKRLYR
jgi:hypothetical protein